MFGYGSQSQPLWKRRDHFFCTYLEYTLHERATGDAALQLIYLRTGFIYVERPDNNKSGRGEEVSLRDGDLLRLRIRE